MPLNQYAPPPLQDVAQERVRLADVRIVGPMTNAGYEITTGAPAAWKRRATRSESAFEAA